MIPWKLSNKANTKKISSWKLEAEKIVRQKLRAWGRGGFGESFGEWDG